MNSIAQMLLSMMGMGTILASLFLGVFVLDNVKPVAYFLHFPSFLVVWGGVVGIALCTTPIGVICDLVKNITTRSATQVRQKVHKIEGKLSDMTDMYYRKGPKNLAEALRSDSQFTSTWRMIADKLDARVGLPDIQMIVSLRKKRMEADLAVQINVLRKLTTLAPSFGMFGTILGLVKLLGNLTDFSSIGPNMSLALLTTLYGIFVSQVMISPLVAKIENLKVERLKNFQQALLWLYMIENKKPAFYLESTRNVKETKGA